MFSYRLLFLLMLKFCTFLCDSNCRNLMTCSECISYAYEECVWCLTEDKMEQRCQSLSYQEKHKSWCKGSVYNPALSLKVLRNDTFNSGQDGGTVVQFLPQNMEIVARPGVPVQFNISYKPAKDYPLDIYYVMDYSYTMRQHQQQLRDQGQKIYQELTKLTNNVQLGLGCFVEKPALPFAGQINNAFSFKNLLSLTQNMTMFQEVLMKNISGSNRDDPEGGLDALMQIMKCQSELGWRENARRIIVLSTDSTYHSAGDGKFVGAVKPNDMKCHLEDNKYNKSLDFDYPSVSQINKAAIRNNFKIIFAVTPNVKKVYEGLAKKIQGAKSHELNQGSNLVTNIIKEYLELISSVEINAETPAHLELSLKPDCRIEGNCILKHNESLNILATLKVKKCPTGYNPSMIRLGPIALKDKLNISVLSDCVCECERELKPDINSTKCNKNGTYQCGICSCNENRYGDNCQCDGYSTNSIDLDKCKMNENDTTYCSGKGTCSCGKCIECNYGYSGAYCQFDDTACPSPGGKICAGKGTCRYEKCECEPDSTGPGCECPISNKNCIAPHSKEVCSGNGKCKCGECVCLPMKSTNRTCSGRFCDSCDEFAEKRCLELEDYAECNYVNSKIYCDRLYNNSNLIEVKVVDNLNETLADQEMAKWCKKHYDNGTALVFKFMYPLSSPNVLHVVIQKKLEQLPKVNLFIAIGVPFGLLIVIGLLTIIVWKIIVDILDAKEYKIFYKKAVISGYTVPEIVNPFYRAPNVNISNPAFGTN